MLKELTIAQVQKTPAAFMYVFASDKFLACISKKYANIIRTKRANQIKLLKLSAEKYLKDINKVDQYYSAVKSSFTSMYGMTPLNALVVLAQGGTVAGKNWSKGVFGIGATTNTTFNDVKLNGQAVTCDPDTGHILCGGKDITASGSTVYSNVNGKATAYQLFGQSQSGNLTFQSQYDKKTGKYYAYAVSNAESGEMTSASTGKVISGADGGDVWGNIVMVIQQFIEWLMNLFGKGKTLLNAENTLPSQTTDGFTYGSPAPSESSMLLIALVAGGALLATSGKGKKGKKPNK